MLLDIDTPEEFQAARSDAGSHAALERKPGRPG
jgi:hypothetical protein